MKNSITCQQLQNELFRLNQRIYDELVRNHKVLIELGKNNSIIVLSGRYKKIN